jgi:hypothetical protein
MYKMRYDIVKKQKRIYTAELQGVYYTNLGCYCISTEL